MDLSAKKILFIDLTKQEFEIKSFPDLFGYVGGVGVGLRLLSQYANDDPIIFSVGPLNGFFPYVSKTSVILNLDGVVEDLYLGGSLSFRIRFMGFDAIVIYGRAKNPMILDMTHDHVHFRSKDSDINSLGLPGKRSTLVFDKKILLDDYFTAPEDILERKFTEKKLRGLVFTGDKTYEIKKPERYEELYIKILARINEITVPRDFYQSCSGCPMGCSKSKTGEIGGNVLIHSLVACTFAEKIYSDVNVTFSCLNVLGYHYTHEDLEKLPDLIAKI